MAKKSQRRLVRHERDQSGCMWGLISMFDFRHGRTTQKLLSDRRRGTRHVVASGKATNKPDPLIILDENCQDTAGDEESTLAVADAGKPSVKKLMEEEMFCEKDSKEINIAEAETEQYNPEDGGHKRKSRKRTNRSRTKSCEIFIEDLNGAEILELEKPDLQNFEKQSTKNLDMDVMMEEFCHQIHHISCTKHGQQEEVYNQSKQKNPDFEEKLSEAIKLFLSQRLVNGKHVTGTSDIHPSKEFKDALKILSSDEELSLKLLEGPKSVIAKYVENLWNAQMEKDGVCKPLVGSNLSEQEIHDLKQSEEIIHSKQRKFFRRKAKSVDKNPLKGAKASRASNTIVILKPSTKGLERPDAEGSHRPTPESQFNISNKGPNERVGSLFFLTEIKRRLKQAMGKEQQEIPPDGVPKRSSKEQRAKRDGDRRYKESVGRNSPSKDHFFIEKIARPPVSVKKAEKTDKLKGCEISNDHGTVLYPRQRLSNIYIEAKKHLCEMFSNGTADVDISNRQVPKTLGRILSLPEYNCSPIGSPGRDWEQSFATAQMRLSANDKFQKQENVSHLGRMTLNSVTELHASDDRSSDKAEASSNTNLSVSNEHVHDNEMEKISCSIEDGPTLKGDVDVVKTTEILVQEDSNVIVSLFEPSDSAMTRNDQNADISEVCDSKTYSECSKHDLHEECQPASPSTSSITKKHDDPEGAVEVSERRSPVSVLEPLFIEGDISPASIRSQPADLPMQPLRIQFEEHDLAAMDIGTHLKACVQDKESIFEYVKAVLQASELNWDEFYIMSNPSDPLLDPSIFDEVGFFPSQLCYDNKLLFDCINEVLMEVYGRYFAFPLGLSFAKSTLRPAPDMKNAIHEVWEGVCWYLLPLPLPCTLEQIIKKDMAKTGTWMDMQCDSEAMIIEIGEAILKDLMEETTLSCINESSDNGNSMIPVGVEDEKSIDL